MSSPQSDFYVYLPSNASPDTFPNNKVNHYKIRFEAPINLFSHSSWEAALIECSYVHNMQTITAEDVVELVAQHDKTYKTDLAPYGPIFMADLKRPKLILEERTEVVNTSVCSIYYIKGSYLDENGIGRCLLTIPERNVPSIYSKFQINRRLAMHCGFIQSDNKDHLIDIDKQSTEEMRKKKQVAVVAEETEGAFEIPLERFRKTESGYEYLAAYPPPSVRLQSYKTEFPISIIYPVANTASHMLSIRQGHYPNCDQLLTELKRMSETVKEYLTWNYYPSNNRFSLSLTSRLFHVKLSTRLANILGFKTNKPRQFSGIQTYTAELAPSLLQGTYHMYVYTDFIEAVAVGHDRVPLLRAIPLQDVAYGQVKSYVFQSAMYVPVSKRIIETVEVQLCDDAGQLLPLSDGKTVLAIHFRPRQT